MRARSIGSALAAVALAGGAAFGLATSAHADPSQEVATSPATAAVSPSASAPAPASSPSSSPSQSATSSHGHGDAPKPVHSSGPRPTKTSAPAPSGPASSAPTAPSTTPSTPTDYVAMLRLIPGGDLSQPFAVPQPYVTSAKITSTDVSAAVNAILSAEKCGTSYQLDIYLDDATTAALVGVPLVGPNNPTEHLATSSSYEVFTTDACAVTTPPATTPPVTTPPATTPPALPTIDLVPVTQTCDTYTVPTLPTGLKFTDGTIPGNNPLYVREPAGTYPLAVGQTVEFQEHTTADFQPASAVYTVTGTACATSTGTPSPTGTPTIPVVTPSKSTGTPIILTHSVPHTAPAAKKVVDNVMPTHKGPLAFTGSEDARPVAVDALLFGIGGGVLLILLSRAMFLYQRRHGSRR